MPEYASKCLGKEAHSFTCMHACVWWNTSACDICVLMPKSSGCSALFCFIFRSFLFSLYLLATWAWNVITARKQQRQCILPVQYATRFEFSIDFLRAKSLHRLTTQVELLTTLKYSYASIVQWLDGAHLQYETSISPDLMFGWNSTSYCHRS